MTGDASVVRRLMPTGFDDVDFRLLRQSQTKCFIIIITILMIIIINPLRVMESSCIMSAPPHLRSNMWSVGIDKIPPFRCLLDVPSQLIPWLIYFCHFLYKLFCQFLWIFSPISGMKGFISVQHQGVFFFCILKTCPNHFHRLFFADGVDTCPLGDLCFRYPLFPSNVYDSFKAESLKLPESFFTAYIWFPWSRTI